MSSDRLTENFRRSEFACRCGCGFDRVAPELVELLQMVRDRFCAPVTITSGCRCSRHNAAIGGVFGSRHVTGEAADIQVAGATPQHVADWLQAHFPRCLGIGVYPTWVHVDIREAPARWAS